jgi:hypothetical protein
MITAIISLHDRKCPPCAEAAMLSEEGRTPPGVDDPTVYAVRSGGVLLPRGLNWVDATKALRTAPLPNE